MVTVDISDRLYSEIERRVKESGEFKSVEEYITFVLEELFKDEEKVKDRVVPLIC